MSDAIVVLVPVYNRPHRVRPLLDSFEASRSRDTRMLFITSAWDPPEIQAILDEQAPYLVFPQRRGPGDWAKKINHGYRHTSEPWILCAADDIHFHPGWDSKLRRAGRRRRVLGTNDLNPHANPVGIYSPHPMVARSYADELGVLDRPGLIVCEDYDHNYSDRELAATAIARNEWAYVPDAVVEHLHPGWTESQDDATYRIGAARATRDYRLHLRRSKLWKLEARRCQQPS